jgi:hypothetical protein
VLRTTLARYIQYVSRVKIIHYIGSIIHEKASLFSIVGNSCCLRNTCGHLGRLFGGMCRRGIYDNMATAVETVFVRKERRFKPPLSRHVLALTGRTDRVHAGGGVGRRAGREPGRQCARAPVQAAAALCRLRRLNAWLEARCLAQARENAHPEQGDKTIWKVFEAERASLSSIAVRSTPSARSKSRCRRAAWCAST